MAAPKPVKDLLESEMDRRQFLGTLGAAALMVTGVSGLVGGLAKLSRPGSARGGYGLGSYGGGRSGTRRS